MDAMSGNGATARLSPSVAGMRDSAGTPPKVSVRRTAP